MRSIVLSLFCCGLMASGALAQGGPRTGPVLGVYASHASSIAVKGIISVVAEDGTPISLYEEETGSAAGIGVLLGYRWAPWLLGYADWSHARLPGRRVGSEGDHTLNELEVGARFSVLRSWAGLNPYVGAGIGRRDLYATLERVRPMPGEQALWGYFFRVGGGVEYRVRPSWELEAGAAYGQGTFSNLRLQRWEYETNASSTGTTRAHLGLRWHPGL